METHCWDVLCRPWKQLLVRKLWHQTTCSISSSLASLRRTSLPRWKTHDLCLLYKFLFSWICLKFTRGLVLIFLSLSFISLQGNYENRTVFESLDIGWQLLRSLTSTNGRSPHEIMTSFQNLPQGDVEEDPSLNSGRVLPPWLPSLNLFLLLMSKL